MVPEIPSESFRVLNQLSCLETWSKLVVSGRGGCSLPAYKTWGWALGQPKIEQAGLDKTTVSNTGDRLVHRSTQKEPVQRGSAT